MTYSRAAWQQLREKKKREAPPVEIEAIPAQPVIPPDATCVTATCGAARVWLIRDGCRWLMFVGSRKAESRRRDFASPFLTHAMRTAEAWYGAPDDGWRAGEK